MKQTIYLFIIIALLTACKQNTSTEAATEETSQATATSATTDSIVVVANEPLVTEPVKLELTPLSNNNNLDSDNGESYQFSQNGKSIVEFNETSKKGKIILNNKTYILNSSRRIGDSGYTISGEGVLINIPKIIWNGDEDGGDCQEGKAPTVKISLNNQILDLNNIHVNYCYLSY